METLKVIVSVEVQRGSPFGWCREEALPPAAPLALDTRTVLRVDSHSAFSPSFPQTIMPAEAEQECGGQGQQGLGR